MEINLKEYLMIIKKRLWLIVAWVLLCTTLTAIYSSLNYQPIYTASTKLIVNKTSDKDPMGKEQIDYGAIGVNLALINTYKEIIKTPAIMDKVVQRYPDLNLSAEQLIAITNVSDLHETQVMTIVASHYSYEKAVKAANAVSDVFQTEIPKIMKVDNVTILNRAKMQEHPVPINKKSNQYIILSFVGSLVVAIGAILMLDAMDDTLKKEADIRALFETSMLASIPKIREKELRQEKRNIARRKAGEAPYAKTVRE
ncbi:YveK family protein [Paenibacillus rigui]|uniref:Lipopolysaccharide biosynthesis protein n=1 Tax=Paenibacillus rigui TaxID=554312 RepID=A0A229UPB6_9BACL|nr:Wzz/FepE/Etk N-terminal domain-containing protein [Paenibacillus rigui]OXM85200.1 lipopolysaccharide biosynthesis protein [Paenibacillus rigui]